MNDNLKNLLFFLANPHETTQEHLKHAIQVGLNYLLYSSSHNINKKDISALLKQGINTRDPFKAILINYALLHLEQNPKYSAFLKAAIPNYSVSLEESNHLFQSLNIDLFNTDENVDSQLRQHLDRKVLKSVFDNTLSKVQQIYNRVLDGKIVGFERTNKVIILTRQMLLPPHAPSVRTLEFAKNIKENYGKEVLIVCSNEYTSQGYSPTIPVSNGSSCEVFFGKDSITYQDTILPFATYGDGVFTEASTEFCIRTILNFKPELILSISAPNLIAEVFKDTSFNFFYMSGSELPFTKTQYYHTWNPPTKEQHLIMQQENIEKQHLFISTPGYHKPVQFSSLKRHDFGLEETSFVFAIIGLRLNTEVTADFKNVIKAIIKGNDKARFLFAGNFSEYETTIQQDPTLNKYCCFIGMQPDIMAVYEMCDVFLNPTRSGGGSSAAQALQAGLPVLTLPSGDVGFMAQNFPNIIDYDEMASTAIRLSLDSNFLEQYLSITTLESNRVSIRDKYLSKIMDKFEKFANQKLLENAQIPRLISDTFKHL